LLDLSNVADGIASMIIKCDAISFEESLQIKLYRIRGNTKVNSNIFSSLTSQELLLDFDLYPDDIVVTNSEEKQISFCLTRTELIRRSSNHTTIEEGLLPHSFEIRLTLDLVASNPGHQHPQFLSPQSYTSSDNWENLSFGHSSEDEESDYYNQFITNGNLV
jgi:hypothetical protein